ncbi:MAG TPA: SAM-dependent methyltransferase [Burkholderiaceae bacterium]|jgi:methyltransferase (TIGR00027 family)|nr:SAM-dependent methyltransferase [Burkholderiaceae bacterium]
MNQAQLVQAHELPLPTPAHAIADMNIYWAQLFVDVQDAIVQGLPPDSQAAQALAWRWLQLAQDVNEAYVATRDDMMTSIKQWITASVVHARLAIFAQYLTAIELAEFQRRQLAHVDDWQILFAEVRQQMLAGAKVTDHAVRVLAQRWQALFRDSYCGENLALENKIRTAMHNEPKLMQAVGLDFSLLGFIQSAILLLNGPQHQSGNAGPKPSAQRVATLRAAHQLLDSPLVLEDPLALKILGDEDETALRANPSQYNDPLSKGLRASLVVRSRLAEDECEKAAENGVRQYVILGAGLDTYAYRSKSCDKQYPSRIFEVDLPETQQWKRACLRAANIQIPDAVTYVPINFEQDTLARVLAAAGFRQDQPAFFSWLGVTMYLEEDAIMETLRYITSCAKGSAVVFDYLIAPSLLTPMERVVINLVATRVAERGEPWKTYFEPDLLAEKLHSLGFKIAHNVSRDALSQRYLSNRVDDLSLGNSSRLMHAIV